LLNLQLLAGNSHELMRGRLGYYFLAESWGGSATWDPIRRQHGTRILGFSTVSTKIVLPSLLRAIEG